MVISKGKADSYTERVGSKALRYNEGKTPLELIPLNVIASTYYVSSPITEPVPGSYPKWLLIQMLRRLGRFQVRQTLGTEELLGILEDLGPGIWKDCAAVFDYGRRKYSEWNWAKGLSWQSVIGCAARHLVFGMLAGEELDKESRLPHRGHLACNIVMLITFDITYREGDDRPAKELFGIKSDETSV